MPQNRNMGRKSHHAQDAELEMEEPEQQTQTWRPHSRRVPPSIPAKAPNRRVNSPDRVTRAAENSYDIQ